MEAKTLRESLMALKPLFCPNCGKRFTRTQEECILREDKTDGRLFWDCLCLNCDWNGFVLPFKVEEMTSRA